MALSQDLRKPKAKSKYPFAFNPADPSTWWKDPKTGKLTEDAKLRQTERQKVAETKGWVKHGEDFSEAKLDVGSRRRALYNMGLLPWPTKHESLQPTGGMRGHTHGGDYPIPAGSNPGAVGGSGGASAAPHAGPLNASTGGTVAPSAVLHASMVRAGVTQKDARSEALNHAVAALQIAMDTESHAKPRARQGSYRQPGPGVLVDEYRPKRRRKRSPRPPASFSGGRLSSSLRSAY